MFVCLESETVIDMDEVLLLLADHYTACICWVPLHIIMMRNLLVRASVNSVIDSTVLTFYSITSKIGPSLDIGNLLIFKFAGRGVLRMHHPYNCCSWLSACCLLLLLHSQGKSSEGSIEWMELKMYVSGSVSA